jgi:hypothetical protein
MVHIFNLSLINIFIFMGGCMGSGGV